MPERPQWHMRMRLWKFSLPKGWTSRGGNGPSVTQIPKSLIISNPFPYLGPNFEHLRTRLSIPKPIEHLEHEFKKETPKANTKILGNQEWYDK